MFDVLRALSISAGILLSVVVFIVIISMAAVKRGEAAMHGEAHEATSEPHASSHGATAELKKPEKPSAAVAADEISVANILVLGLVLFGLAVFVLFAVSLIGQL